MLSPELLARSSRPYISTSTSAPSISTAKIGSSYFSDPNPYPSPNLSPSSGFQAYNDDGSSRSAKNSRFSPSVFAHNGRIAVALAPCAAFLLDLGGTPVVATLIVGLMFSYILDSLNFKPAAFFGVWFSLLSAQIAFFFCSPLILTFNSVALAILAAFLCAETNFLIGVWASLQFRWIQIENPSIVLALERLLFACVPISASSLFTWATISAVGMNNASYYLMSFNCFFYWLYSMPRVSSFKTKHEARYHGGEVPNDNYILGPLESCFHTLDLLFFPLVFHIASHYSIVFSSVASVCDILLLFFIPFLFQLYASTRGALWWVTTSENQLQSIRVVNGAVAMIFIVISLESRVIFHSFGRYIQVPPPLSYVLVTTTMLGGAVGAGAYAMGMISDAFSSVAFTTLAVTVSATGALVIGFPVVVRIPNRFLFFSSICVVLIIILVHLEGLYLAMH